MLIKETRQRAPEGLGAAYLAHLPKQPLYLSRNDIIVDRECQANRACISLAEQQEGQVIPALPFGFDCEILARTTRTINDQVGHTYSSHRWRDQPDWPLPARHWISW